MIPNLTGKPILMILHLNLIRANAMLYKVRDFVNAGILKSIYHALLFELHIHYACTIWGQNVCTINQLFILQKKALRWFILKNVMPILLLSFSNQKLCNFQTKLKLKIVFSSASMSATNHLPSLTAGFTFPPLFITMKLHFCSQRSPKDPYCYYSWIW